MSFFIHPIMEQSFAVIDREIGEHNFSPAEYAIVRRVIHSTADFEFKQLIRFSPGAIEAGISALRNCVPIVTDVGMVKQGSLKLVAQTFGNQMISAVEQAPVALPGKTRTETGLLQCWEKFPEAIYAIGNAPTALLALCAELATARQFAVRDASRTPLPSTALAHEQRHGACSPLLPALVIGAPVGFISVVESKTALAHTPVNQIRVEGRKGGSPVAAAILNALIMLAWEEGGRGAPVCAPSSGAGSS